MATNKNITMKQFNGVDYDTLYPKTIASQVDDVYSKNEVDAAIEAAQTAGMKVVQIYRRQTSSENVQEIDLGEHFNTAKMLIVGFVYGTYNQDAELVIPGLFNQVNRSSRSAAIMVDTEQTGQAYNVYHVGAVELKISGTVIKIASAIDCIDKRNIPNFKFAYLFAVE